MIAVVNPTPSFASFPVHHSRTILPFDVVEPEILTAINKCAGKGIKSDNTKGVGKLINEKNPRTEIPGQSRPLHETLELQKAITCFY
jgi:hypothetical protein